MCSFLKEGGGGGFWRETTNFVSKKKVLVFLDNPEVLVIKNTVGLSRQYGHFVKICFKIFYIPLWS